MSIEVPGATFDPALGTVRDQLRHALGDFDLAAPLRLDVTYDAMIGLGAARDSAASYELALLWMAESLINEFAQKPDAITTDGDAVTWKARIEGWRTLVKSLRAQGYGSVGASAVGNGVTILTMTRRTPTNGPTTEWRR